MKTLRFNRRARAALLAALALATFAFIGTSAQAQTSPLLGGDIVVTLYGKAGTTATSGTYTDGVATPISLQEFSATTISAGIDNTTPLLDETLPTSGTGGNAGIVGEFGSSSEGTIQVSGNGQYLSIGGYDGNLQSNGAVGGVGYGLGTNPAEAQSTDVNVPRIAALINIGTGAVDTSTVLNDIYNTNNPRSVYTANGTSFYLSGQGASKTDQGGIYTAPLGDNTTADGPAPTPIYNGSSTRLVTQSTVNAATGTTSSAPNTYVSIDQNGKSVISDGIFEFSGSPTGATALGTRITTATATTSNGLANLSPQGFFFANPTTLYVADTGDPKSGGTGNGGLQKWTFSSANNAWTLDYTLTASTFVPPTQATTVSDGETGLASITGVVNANGTVSLFGTSYTAGDADPDGLYGFVDTLSNTSASAVAGDNLVELATSGADSDFKGVAFIPAAVPVPSSWALAGLAVAGFAWLRRRTCGRN
jgi:hypothetical protein